MGKTKKCRICGEEKSFEAFYKRENGKLRNECIECQKQRIKHWYNKTKDVRLSQRRDYHYTHKEESNKKQREYYYRNRETILKKYCTKRKSKKKDLVQKEIEIMRWTLQGIMHAGWGYTQPKNKERKEELEKIFGCSIDFLKNYLYKTWKDRYKKPWNGELFHIDHIVPLQTANSVNDVQNLCHYSNLRMLTPEDNLARTKLEYSKALRNAPS